VPDPRARADELLGELGLSHVADNLIGHQGVGLSGGEKKRVSIGVELVSDPHIVFLDEPTSGLDYFSAYAAIKMLQEFRDKAGLTILCSIHQPAPELLGCFDDVILLGKGHIIFHGPLRFVPYYLADCGIDTSQVTNDNIGDFIISLLQTLEDAHFHRLALRWDLILKGEASLRTNIPQVVRNDTSITPYSRQSTRSDWDANQFHPPNSIVKTWFLLQRGYRQITRDYSSLMVKGSVTIGMSLFLGFVFYKAADPRKNDYVPLAHMAGLSMVVLCQVIASSMAEIISFSLERRVFVKEFASGFYGSLPFSIARFILSIPINGVCAFLSWACIYWLFGCTGPYTFFTDINIFIKNRINFVFNVFAT
jgi:energy-coupling factor transporter ATP-binding protein EcfA2